MMGDSAWQVGGDELPGGFYDHRMTGAWLRRLLDPAAFLGPSVLDRGAALRHRTERPALHRVDDLGLAGPASAASAASHV